MTATVHVIGAGLAGLAAALTVSARGTAVVVHEVAPQAGGRCRSYVDPTFGRVIDNGNHLVLAGNREVAAYLRETGGERAVRIAERAGFDFIDLRDQLRWRLDLGRSRIPGWLFDRNRRVAGTRLLDYLDCLPLMRQHAPDATVAAVLKTDTVLYRRLLQPLLLAALNTEPEPASARLAASIVRETLGAGGDACRPIFAPDGLSAAFVEPALATLARRGASIRFGHRLKALVPAPDGARVAGLVFDDGVMTVGAGDAVVLAVPAHAAAALLPGLVCPTRTRAIVNVHYDVSAPADAPPIVGVVGGLVEWVFAYPDRVSITISGADRLLDAPRERLAEQCWRDVVRALALPPDQPLPRWQVVREKRATFAALPAEDALRPGAQSTYQNLLLAGDWTATGLPATIEGALRSGRLAGSLACAGAPSGRTDNTVRTARDDGLARSPSASPVPLDPAA
ncbi:hydroxysqualene dehydroxylase HpnE [Chitinasiproducens palmae]|uniref:Squalene-associated FAD-dependent desaturase n=1 Tax=Chitinasiproducens palmae TaxID=1770053 RepID=A0A1H2PTB0_9BURK|nr:hydroxysqualene dehydroxylase HpnE [Chitinasiproducens palmae]SDV49905.1 squalene-associated FAD-dependent desaturase [Chitinasiproducens palmae]